MNRVILPLDNEILEDSMDIINQTHEYVWGYKLRRQILEYGINIIREIKDMFVTNIMVDFKLYDIPSAMDEAVNLFINAGADIITVHCTAQWSFDDFKKNRTLLSKIAGVTILTSFSIDSFLRYYGNNYTMYDSEAIQGTIKAMAQQAKSLGYGYIICSAQEVQELKYISCKKICPGIRPEWYYGKDDQKRIATPREAIKNGADFLVIGRPILTAEDKVEAIHKTNEEIEDII